MMSDQFAGAVDLGQVAQPQPVCARCSFQPPPDVEAMFVVARDGRMVCLTCVAEVALTVPVVSPQPAGLSKEGFVLQCGKCEARQLLPNVGGGRVSIREAQGWYVSDETGPLCPMCAPPRDGDSPGIGEGAG